jgi:hypothetical protein
MSSERTEKKYYLLFRFRREAFESMPVKILTNIGKEVFSDTFWYNSSDDGNTGTSNGSNIGRSYITSLNIGKV